MNGLFLPPRVLSLIADFVERELVTLLTSTRHRSPPYWPQQVVARVSDLGSCSPPRAPHSLLPLGALAFKLDLFAGGVVRVLFRIEGSEIGCFDCASHPPRRLPLLLRTPHLASCLESIERTQASIVAPAPDGSACLLVLDCLPTPPTLHRLRLTDMVVLHAMPLDVDVRDAITTTLYAPERDRSSIYVVTDSLRNAMLGVRFCATTGAVLSSTEFRESGPAIVFPVGPDVWLRIAEAEVQFVGDEEGPMQHDFLAEVSRLTHTQPEFTVACLAARDRVLLFDAASKSLVLAAVDFLPGRTLPSLRLLALADRFPSYAPFCTEMYVLAPQRVMCRSTFFDASAKDSMHVADLSCDRIALRPVSPDACGCRRVADPWFAAVRRQIARQQEARLAGEGRR